MESTNNVPEKYLHSMYKYRSVDQYVFLSCIYKILYYIQYLYYLQNIELNSLFNFYTIYDIFMNYNAYVTCKLYYVLSG